MKLLVECVDEVVTVERSPASPTDARSLIWSCCSWSCVDGHDAERLVGQKRRLDINEQRDTVVSGHKHVQLVTMPVSPNFSKKSSRPIIAREPSRYSVIMSYTPLKHFGMVCSVKLCHSTTNKSDIELMRITRNFNGKTDSAQRGKNRK